MMEKLRHHDQEAENALASAYVRGEIPEETREELLSPENIDSLLNAIITLSQDLESQFSERKARAQAFQNECVQKGYDGKQEWFSYKADYEKWRASARRFKASVDAAKRDVKARLHEMRQRGESPRGIPLKHENHVLKKALGILLERHGPSNSYLVEDWELEAADSPFLSVEREGEGWRVWVDSRQEGLSG